MRHFSAPLFRSVFVCLFFVIAFWHSANAVTTITVGTGTTTTLSTNGPTTSTTAGARYERHIALYSSADIVAAGGISGGKIMGLAWNKTDIGEYNGAGGPLQFNIYLKNTSQTALPSGTNAVVWATEVSGATLVYSSANQIIPPSVGWLTFNFQTAFPWTSGASSNIEVLVDIYRPASWTNSSFKWQYGTVTNTAATGSNTTAPTTFTRGSSRPNIQFVYATTGNDVALLSMPNPIVAAPGNQDIQVVLRNTGTNTLTDAAIQWQVNGSAPVTYNWSGSLATSATTTATLTNFSFPFGNVTVDAAVTGANLGGDGDASNNTVSKNLFMCAPLAGNYTVNSGAVTSGTNFQTFDDLTFYLTNCGVSDDVIVSVEPGSGPYNEQVVFYRIPNIASDKTVTINGNQEILRYAPNTTDRHILRLDRVSYMTINNLHIVHDTTGSKYAYAIHLLDSVHDVSITNNVIDIKTANPVTSQAGIVASNSTTSVLDQGTFSNLTISGNTITGLGYGMSIYGTNSTGVVINNNNVYDFSSSGIHLTGLDGGLIHHNTINNRTGAVGTYGIQVYGTGASSYNDNCEIYSNIISCEKTTGDFRGIYIHGGTVNKFYNNLIYDVRSTNGIVAGIQIRVAATGHQIYNNTISLDHTTSTSGTLYGFRTETTGTNAQFRNNLISISQPTTGNKAAIGLNTNTGISTTFASNNNVLWVPGGITAAYGTSTTFTPLSTTLADWQTNSQDANSWQADPFFESLTLPRPTSGTVNDKGTNTLASATDILGTTRGATPDIGAYEFTPPPNDAAITDFIEPLPPVCAGIPIRFTLNNSGTDPLNDVDIAWSLNGVPQDTVHFASLALAPGSSINLTLLASQSLAVNTLYDISATAMNPNFSLDANSSNNTYTQADFRSGLNGSTYTINSADTASGLNFTSFQGFSDALTAFGVCGPVVASVSNGLTGIYTEQAIFTTVPGGSSTNTVTINGNNRILQYNQTAPGNERGTLAFNGGSYYTINGLQIKALGTSYGYAVRLFNNASQITFDNCRIEASITQNNPEATAGLVSSSSIGGDYQGAGVNSSFVTVRNCTLVGGHYGISLYQIAGNLSSGNLIENNLFEDQAGGGIMLGYTSDAIIRGNQIYRANRVGTLNGFDTEAILIDQQNTNLTIEKNIIRDLRGTLPTSTTYGATGIHIESNSDGTAGVRHKIHNNLIYNMQGLEVETGIYCEAEYVDIYHNTVVIADSLTPGTVTDVTSGFMTGISAAVNNINLKNNIFYLGRSGAAGNTKRGIDIATGSTSLSFDNNAVYLTGPGNKYYGRYSGIDYATRSGFSGASGLEVNSVEANPNFVDAPAGDYMPQSSDLNSAGANVGVTTDILGVSRNVTTPDIGAIEFNLPANDAGVIAILPAVPYCAGTQQVIAVVKNYGSATLTSVTINWNFGGSSQTVVNATGLNIPSNGTGQIVLGTKSFTAGATHTIDATTSLPNGSADAIPANNAFTAEPSKPGLSGTYTLNSAVLSGGTNYQTFSALAAELDTVGVCGPVVVNVDATSGPYTEQVTFNVIPGTSAVNTVVINGNGRTLRFGSVDVNNRHTLKLNGADYVTIDSLTIQATSTGATPNYGWAVHLTNESNNNSIINSTISADASSTTSSQYAGIVISNSVTGVTIAGKNASNTLIQGNTISGGSHGITVVGDDNFLATGNQIRNNNVREFAVLGIYLDNQVGAIVSGNDVQRPTRTNASSGITGIRLTGADSENNLIENNRVHNLFDGMATSTTHNGISISSADATPGNENKVINNLVYNMNNIGASVGIENSGSDGAYFYHNTIVLDYATAATTTARGFYQNLSASNIRFYNNVVVVTRAGTGTKHGIYLNTAGSSVTSQYNNIYVSGTAANVGRANSIDYASGIAWSGTSYDNIDSRFVDPQFLDVANGNLQPNASAMNNMGINGLGVPTDILGLTRSATAPDAGAYEYSPCFNGLWTGNVSDDWFTAGNWCFNTIPTSAINVVVPDVSGASNRYPVIEGNVTAVANGIQINPGATITLGVIGGNSPTLEIYGDVDNMGAPSLGTGNLTFMGTAQALLGPVEISGIVRINTGSTLTTNGNLTIQSGGQLLHGAGTPGGGGNISSHPIKIKRAGLGSANLWNYWGTPVVGANVNILGNRLYYYDPLSATDPNTTAGLRAGWKNASGVMTRGRGYISNQAPVVTFTGTVHDLNSSASFTTGVDAGVVPYNLIGNPFPSAMDATLFMNVNGPASAPFFGNGTLTGTMWFWDDDGSGGFGYQKTDFAAWSGAGGVAGPNNPSKTPNGHIGTAQGFNVEKIDPGAGVVSFDNTMRSANNTVFFRQKPIERLWVNVTNTYGLYNEVLIAFIDDATDGYDAGYDAKKMRGNPNIALYTKMDTKDYMIQAFSPIITEKVVELGLDAGLTGAHTLNLKTMENLDETVVPVLEDRLTGTWQNLRKNPSYTFNVTTPGTISGRFYLHFNAPMEVTATEESCSGADAQILINQPGEYYWGLIVADAQGNVVANDNAFTGAVVLENLASGVYTVLLSDRDGYQVTKQITVNGKQQVTADFEAQSNIAFVDEEIAFVNHSSGATSYHWDFGDGTLVSGVENPVHTYTEAGSYTVILRAANSDCYQSWHTTVEVTKLSTGIGGVNSGLNVYSYGKKIFAKLNLNDEKARMLVYDVVGKEIYSKDISTKGSYEVDLSRHPDHSYFVVIRTATETYRTKVMLSGNNQ